jgi:hypothetical protein
LDLAVKKPGGIDEARKLDRLRGLSGAKAEVLLRNREELEAACHQKYYNEARTHLGRSLELPAERTTLLRFDSTRRPAWLPAL